MKSCNCKKIKKHCELCGAKAYRKRNTPDCGIVTMCKDCYSSYNRFCKKKEAIK